MENASKALIMAGSILLSLLVIGTVVFLYNRLRDIEQTKVDSEYVTKLVEYGKKFEQYTRTLHGQELLSLANLQEDYEKTQANTYGYTPIEVKVKIKRAISFNLLRQFFKTGVQDISNLLDDRNTIENEIKKYEEEPYDSKNRTVKAFSQMSNRQIASIYNEEYHSSVPDYDIPNITKNPILRLLYMQIEEYKEYKSIYTTFANKKFKCTETKYNEGNGRIEYMYFEEI